MKRNILITGIAGFVILGGAVGANAISPSNKKPITQSEEKSSIITMQKATEIAINEVDGVLESVELDKENGRFIYEVDLSVPGYEDVDVDIDATTGAVIKVDKERAKQTKVSQQNENKNMPITEEKAISIALSDTQGEVTEIDFDSEDLEYEMEISTGNKEVEIKVDAKTGKILEKDIDDNHDD
ncbi:PepSY domain-containing protein [Lederbergia sp. NSJ-179]|uniref:PepSY domain-containing protein n=1 Tax=Lederbergia sp. NSJ-179 TaxID=2931402 RepID=UPI001FD31F5A|nr:PepSY domain-containing protein [Lederbergia sp. NSJ-179]MCJ7842482.1 PepSY domain-containing protein [Lederbergia sp. NSJ-179]